MKEKDGGSFKSLSVMKILVCKFLKFKWQTIEKNIWWSKVSLNGLAGLEIGKTRWDELEAMQQSIKWKTWGKINGELHFIINLEYLRTRSMAQTLNL